LRSYQNEGLPLALAAVLSISWFSVGPRMSLSALGILVGIRFPWFLFTNGLGLSNAILNAADLRPARVIRLLPRTIPIAEAWVSELFTFRRWGLLAFAACLAFFILRWKPRRDLMAAVLGSIALLTFVYVVTPRNLVRQLGNSLGRVAIAPMGLLALSMATARLAARGANQQILWLTGDLVTPLAFRLSSDVAEALLVISRLPGAFDPNLPLATHHSSVSCSHDANVDRCGHSRIASYLPPIE
jgi:hypothetical protein